MLRRNELVNLVKNILMNRESDLKWAIAYGDYDEPFQEIAEDIVQSVLNMQNS